MPGPNFGDYMQSRDIWRIAHLAANECEVALKLHTPMNSPHEGYAVILEEVDELWELVKGHHSESDRDRMKKEAIQIAAMAIRFVGEVLEEK